MPEPMFIRKNTFKTDDRKRTWIYWIVVKTQNLNVKAR